MKPEFYYRTVVLLFFALLLYTKAEAQQVFGSANHSWMGDAIEYNLPGNLGGDEFLIDRRCLVRESYGFVGTFNGITPKEIYCVTEPGEEIIGQTLCIINKHVVVTLLISKGPGNFTTVVYNDFYGTTVTNPDFTASAEDIAGDALYVRSANMVYKSDDHGATWAIDTAGLNSTYLHGICTDTFQKVYLASNLGLLTQDANGSTWVKNTNYPGNYCGLVYADRRSRVFAVAAGNILYTSADTGASFQLDTAGLGNLGLRQITSIGDDAYGNIYVIVDKKQIYRSGTGTQPFVQIAQSLSALNNDSLSLSPFNHVSGDSVLFAATAFGCFYSMDQGNTWTANNVGIAAQSFYGLVEANSGQMLATTNLGCFRTTDAADTAWVKVYPDTGYVGGRPLFKDNNGALYTQGGTIGGDVNFQTRMVVKSTDNANSWLPDTLGISPIIMAKWYVDESGAQHAAQWGSYSAPTQLFSKAPGQSWVADNGGFSGDSALPLAFGSNGSGKIYYSGKTLYSKQGAGNWVADSTGLGTAIGVYDFAHNSSGNMYLGCYAGIWKQNGTTWTELPPPAGIYNSNSAFAVAVDASNTAWAAFSHFDAYYNSVGDGVYYTSDGGATWHKPGFEVDTTTFLKLVAVGDSVYGLSYYSGVYLFDKNTSAITGTGENNIGLRLFPNPASSYCNLQLSNSPEICSASVFDITGREVLPLFSSQHISNFNFSTDKLSPGLYFVKVSDGKGKVGVGKLVRE